MPKPGTAKQRGYGYQHDRLAAALKRLAVGKPCCICGRPMTNIRQMDLDHTADRTGYRGIAHSSCNRSDGARRSNHKRRNRKRTRDW